MRFAIYTHVIHNRVEGKYFAYSPYVWEINLWLNNVKQVEIIAPLSPHLNEIAPQPLSNALKFGMCYQHDNLIFTPIPNFDILKFGSAIKAVFNLPYIFLKMVVSMGKSDHIHLRCPGNIGLIACVAQIFSPGKPKTAKYAGNWDPNAQQPWSYKIQRWILSNTFLTRNMKVLVYGQWPNQTQNILPFFTASFGESDKEMVEKDFNRPIKFLFVGNLVPGKQPLLALQVVEALREKNIEAKLHVYGDGPLKYNLEKEAGNKDYIHLHGNQPLEVLKQAYKDSHFLILASKSEGWPKAVAEAMFFGCIPIATSVSCVPWMLGGGSRGILAPPAPEGGALEKWLEKIVLDVQDLINKPEEMRKMSLDAQQWSQQYTLEKFEAEIKKLLVAPQPPKGEQKRKL